MDTVTRGLALSDQARERHRRALGLRILPALLGGSVAVLAGHALAAEVSLTPIIAISETYTDNVRLLPPGLEVSDWVTEVRGGLRLGVNGSRARIRANYQPSLFIYAGENEEDFRHNFSGNGQIELMEDHFFVNAAGSVRESFVSNQRDISISERNLSGDRREVRVYTVSPRWEQRFGSWATGQLSYRLERSELSRLDTDTLTNFTNSTGHNVVGRVVSGQNFQRVRWDLTTGWSRQDRSSANDDFEEAYVRLGASYNLNRFVALIGSIGYQDISAQSLSRERDGITWDAGVRLTPSRDTRVSATYGRLDNQHQFNVSATARAGARTKFNVSYNERITTSQSVLRDQLIDLGGDAAPDPLADLQPGIDFTLTNDVFRRKRFAMSMSYRMRRTSLSMSSYIERRTFDFRPREEAASTSGRITHTFSRYLEGSVGANYIRREYVLNNRVDNIYLASARLSRQLLPDVSSYLAYNLTKRKSNDVFSRLEENAVTVGLSANF